MKLCNKCNNVLNFTEFYKTSKKGKVYYRGSCKLCESIENKKRYKILNDESKNVKKLRKKSNLIKIKSDPELLKGYKIKCLLYDSKNRAKNKKLPFNLEEKDIIIPEYCPIFNHIKLCLTNDVVSDDSPSIDEIVRGVGYIKGNIIVTSNKANKMKNNGTLEECIILGKFWDNYLKMLY